MNEIVICAAVKTQDGGVVRGHRHSDCIHAIEIRGLQPVFAGEGQGFITSGNRFVTREEGRKLQDEAGIQSVDQYGYQGDTLYSEDLY